MNIFEPFIQMVQSYPFIATVSLVIAAIILHKMGSVYFAILSFFVTFGVMMVLV